MLSESTCFPWANWYCCLPLSPVLESVRLCGDCLLKFDEADLIYKNGHQHYECCKANREHRQRKRVWQNANVRVCVCLHVFKDRADIYWLNDK